MNNNGDTCSTCRFNKLESDEERCKKCTEDLHQYPKWKSIPTKTDYVTCFDEGGYKESEGK